MKLLREDEEFRFAVAGLIGLEDIRVGIARFEDARAKLADAQARLEERQTRLEEALAKLAEAQAMTETAFQELMKQVDRLSDVVGFGLKDMRES
ncbi:MAG: hypothetical protein QW614_05505 [Candidatus Caldarchaeum sp.]